MKKEVEDFLIANERIQQLWDTGDVLNISKKKFLKVSTKKLKVDTVYDVDEVTVEFKHDVQLNDAIQVRTVIEAMRQMQVEVDGVRKVIYESNTVDDAEKEGSVIFTVISFVDKI